MNDKRSGPVSQVVKFGLLILSCIYGVLVRCNQFFYQVNLLRSYKSPIAVASIGNITLGGTGKTPFVMMLSEWMTQRGKKTAVLIRGYGEDEWKMLEDRLGKSGIKVFVGRNRVRYAKKALQFGFDSLILDDGFQHRRLRRDLDIVLLDSTNPFGNRHLLPRGILRENLGSLRRADIIVLTKVDKGKGNATIIEDEIEKIAPGKRIIKAVHKPKRLFDIRQGREKEMTPINGKRVCIISAICDPSYFKYTVEKTGAVVGLEFIFPDHHPYRMRDLNRIFGECEKRKIDTIITTEKDAVKLKRLIGSENRCQILALSIELEIIQGNEELDAGIRNIFNT